ncbi:hypothetical protein [Limisalsivibrio acetivorans]|uniref:hypothetical protein n=1 Tax=Limisalsivibrio acetivorans TaxID=1304888 RepID=UPI0003B66614|nr:hypothetical protein [Limisalsivibrio acetivorans]
MLLVISGCIGEKFDFRTGNQLNEDYTYSVRDEYFRLFYNVAKVGDSTVIMASVKNVGRVYMNNLSFEVTECCDLGRFSKKSHKYVNLGSLKMMRVKEFRLTIPDQQTKRIVLKYDFTPSDEQRFLNPETNTATPPPPRENISGEITLLLGK